ncbi:MAG: type I secretion system permease/ATPase [Rhodobacteraceae bacterium]|nr:type I secretion system permease/ATPase [Paracoccaceae bacterium]
MSGQKTFYPTGLAELREVRKKSRNLFVSVGFFSIFVNLLMLTGPIFMLQIYDRVLGSRSEATLVALTVLVAFLYIIYGLLEWARGRVLARAGAQFQTDLDERVFNAVLRASVKPGTGDQARNGLQDLESMQRLMASPALFAVCDIPWTPIFAFAIFLFHPMLGYLAVVGGAILIVVTLINQRVSKLGVIKAQVKSNQANIFAGHIRDDREVVQGLGMRGDVMARWRKTRDEGLESSMRSSDLTGGFSSFTKAFRLFLQSAILALGAYYVLQNELSPGAMIAGSILMGRALAPIEMAIGQWPLVQRASQAWYDLSRLLETVPEEVARTPLPRPRAHLKAENLTVVPPGESTAALRIVNFEIHPGTAMGVIGPSAAGKSSLARVITGIWHPASGRIRLDNASLDNYDSDILGRYIGYLPQNVTLFDATVAENIARMSENPNPEMVVAAAKKAGAHEMILEQPNGYDTVIGNFGGRLSGGQRQRLGLARALYGNPIILVLDEPNSNLDSVGSSALNDAIRSMKEAGNSVIIMAHRPAGIAECETLLVLKGGVRQAFGPRDEVLKERVENVAQISDAIMKERAGTK